MCKCEEEYIMSEEERKEALATRTVFKIPHGYPGKLCNDAINKQIQKFLNHIIVNEAGDVGIVQMDAALVNLGLQELNNRTTRAEIRLAFKVSTISAAFTIVSVFIAILALIRSS